VWNKASHAHLSVMTPVFADGKVRFFGELDAVGEWSTHLSQLVTDGFAMSYSVDDSFVPLSVVGDRFSQDGAALQEVIEKLAQNHISVTMGSASALAITVAVPRTHADDGVRALHQEFFG